MLSWDVSLERFPSSRPIPAPRKHRLQDSSTIQPHYALPPVNNYSYQQRSELPFPPNPFAPNSSIQSQPAWQHPQQAQSSWQPSQHFQSAQQPASYESSYPDPSRPLYSPAHLPIPRSVSSTSQHRLAPPHLQLNHSTRRATPVAPSSYSPHSTHSDYQSRESVYPDPYAVNQQHGESSRSHFTQQQSLQHPRARSTGQPTPPLPLYSPNRMAESMPSYFSIPTPTVLPRLSAALVHLSDFAEEHDGRRREPEELHHHQPDSHDVTTSLLQLRGEGSIRDEQPLIMPSTTLERMPVPMPSLKHSSAALALAVTLALATNPEVIPTQVAAHLPKVWVPNEEKKVRCPTQYCSKRFMQLNGLKYHLAKGRCNSSLEEMNGTQEHSQSPEEEEEEDEEENGRAKKIRRVGRVVEGTALERAESRVAQAKGRPFACHLTNGCGKRYKSRAGLRYHYNHSGAHGLIGQELMVDGRHPQPDKPIGK